jgi:hypothetical protein
MEKPIPAMRREGVSYVKLLKATAIIPAETITKTV